MKLPGSDQVIYNQTYHTVQKISLPVASGGFHIYNLLMSRISNLYRVQDIDLKMEQCRKRLEEIQRLLEDNQQLRELRSAAETADEQLAEARRKQAAAEHEVTMQRQKIAGAERKLYSGTVKNPKELQDIQNESAALKRHLTILEDRQLESMIAVEEAEKVHLAASEELEKEEIRSSASQSSMLKEQKQLEQDLEKLETEREAAAAVTRPEDIEVYQSLKKRLGSTVISRVSDGSCGVCGMIVPGSALQVVRSGSELHRCSQCSRILYAG